MTSFFKNIISKATSTIKDYASSFQFDEKQYFKDTDFTDQYIKDKLAS